MVKPEKFYHLHLIYHFTVPLKVYKQNPKYSKIKNGTKNQKHWLSVAIIK